MGWCICVCEDDGTCQREKTECEQILARLGGYEIKINPKDEIRGNGMRKIIWMLLALSFAVGCAGGHQYRVDNEDGTYYRVTDVGHNNMARKGMQYSAFELCTAGGVCSKVAEGTAVNSSFIEMLAGPGAAVGSAELIRKGLSKSGDTVNASAEGGDSSSFSGSYSRSTSTATSNSWAKGGCKGNCK